MTPTQLARCRARNLVALARLDAKIAANKEKAAARAREREAEKRNRAPRTLDDLERLGMVIDIQALRRRGDVLIDGKWSAITPPPGLRSLAVTYAALKIEPLAGAAQLVPLRWRKTVGPYSLVHAQCDCGRRALKLYPKSLDGGGGPWGCLRCSATGNRRDSREKWRGVNRVRVRPAIFTGESAHLTCERDERGRLMPRENRLPPEPPPTRFVVTPAVSGPEPIVHRPFGPCDWSPRLR